MTDAIDTETTEMPLLTQTSQKTVQTYRLNHEGEVRLTSDDGFEEFYAETLDVLYGEDGWERSVVKGRVIGKNNRLLQKSAKRTFTIAASTPVWMIPDRDVTLTHDLAAKFRRALSNMPYGGMAYMTGDFDTVDGIVSKLGALATVLSGVAEKSHRDEAEVTALRRERKAVGSFLLGAMESAAEGRNNS